MFYGYPNWYKNLKAQKAQIFRRPNAANITHDTPLDNKEHIEPGYENNQPGNIDWTEIIQKEVAKYLKDKIPFSHVNFAQSEYAGMPSHISLTSHATTALGRGVWIIDTGASTHMSNTFDFLDQPQPIHPLLPVISLMALLNLLVILAPFIFTLSCCLLMSFSYPPSNII